MSQEISFLAGKNLDATNESPYLELNQTIVVVRKQDAVSGSWSKLNNR
ncbi:hypothetical protein QUB80_33800 [Chlorogloeopsis sp. ULAP01]|nr:hypothetical protein [Chlorogloeopsis sp. ULAP01]MDM9385632.1 hypothetical protein [Chlorogloeopsis sp. ULAP01]